MKLLHRLLVCLFLFTSAQVNSQTLFTENFDSYANISPLPTTGTSWKTVVITSTGAFWQIKNSCTPPSASRCLSMNDNLGTDCDYNWSDNGNEIAYYGTLINAVGYNTLRLNFKWKASGETSGCSGACDYGKVVWSLDGTTWTDVSATQYMGQSSWQTVSNLNLSAADNQQFYIGFRWINDGSTGAAPAFTIDDISITGTAIAACSGTPIAGTTSISSSSGASGVNYTLSNTGATAAGGISYQWQSSTDGTTWTNISGATSTSYTTSASSYSVTYYRLIVTCSNSGISSTSNVVSYTVTSWTQPAGTASASITACSGTYYDQGGSGSNYSSSQNSTLTICPSTAGQYVQVAFTSWGMEANFDYLSVYDGNSTSANMIVGSSFTASSPGTIKATTANSTGCLTFKFYSDGATEGTGWAATISCSATGATPPSNIQEQDCRGAVTICSGANFNYASNGTGIYNDANLGLGNLGCLNSYANIPDGSAEHQSVWGFFSPSASGTVGMTLDPAGSSTTDYDWAIWGPYTTIPCPPTGLPIRCSAASASNSVGAMTGMGNGATDTEEGTSGNGWVSTINVTAGQKYIIMVDNWNSTGAPLTLSWQLSNGASLDCLPLPVELITFSGKNIGNQNHLEWQTASELNNDYFTIERSADGVYFYEIGRVDGSGTTHTTSNYTMIDQQPISGMNYYRLKQTDYDGTSKYSGMVSVASAGAEGFVYNIRPNPTNGGIQFDLLSPQTGSINIEVVDYLGRIVKQENISISMGMNTLNSELNELSKGIYTMKFSLSNGHCISIQRIIKN